MAGDGEPLRVALVGAGRIAQTYAQALTGLPGLRLAAVADVRVEAARALAETAACAAFASVDALLEATGPEAAIVCTPPASHAAVCTQLVRRGVPVLCEKPLSVDSSNARRMLEAARRSGVVLTMASKFRFTSDMVRARSLVASGLLGDVLLVENVFASRLDMTGRWNADRAVGGGGVVIDNGTHSVDLMRFLLGPLTEVRCVEGPRLQPLPVEDTAWMFVRSAAGVAGSIDLSWSLDKGADAYLTIHGSAGTAIVGWSGSRFRTRSRPEWTRFGDGYDKVGAFRDQLTNFAAGVRGRAPLRVTAADALASVATIEAAYVSLREGRWVPVGRPAAPRGSGEVGAIVPFRPRA